MPAPTGYQRFGDWYLPAAPDIMMPDKSIFSTDDKGGWKKGDTKLYGRFAFDRTIQGWKLHVCVRADAIRSLFVVLSPELLKLKAWHKFAIFEDYEAKPETGKACTIYPVDPEHLAVIVRRVEYALANAQALEARGMAAQAKRGQATGPGMQPFEGGVQGDFQVGQMGYVHCRYGGFSGELTKKNRIYNPETGKTVLDRRNAIAYPEFVKSIPSEIQALV